MIPRPSALMGDPLTSQRATTLRAIPMFSACDDAELERVDRLVDEIDVPAGEVLTREGTRGGESFIIVSGEASVMLRDRSLARLKSGEFFGEMAVLAPDRPQSATVTAITPMRLLVIEPGSFFALIDIAGVARALIVTLVERLRTTVCTPSHA